MLIRILRVIFKAMPHWSKKEWKELLDAYATYFAVAMWVDALEDLEKHKENCRCAPRKNSTFNPR
jgi:hypothetical protein